MRLIARRMVTISTLVVFLTSAGCGYHTAGHVVLIPRNVRTIAIPAFVNRTETYKIEQTLTAAVVREILTRTRYHIINSPSEDADATLRGIVLNAFTSPLTYDSQTGRAASIQVVINMRVSLTDKHGKSLYDNAAYSFRDQYQVSSESMTNGAQNSKQLTSFFEEDSPALRRLSRDFANTLVSNLLEGF